MIISKEREVTNMNVITYQEKKNPSNITTSYNKALSWGAPIDTLILSDSEKPTLATPIRQAMLDQFGYAHPRLKDKVVL